MVDKLKFSPGFLHYIHNTLWLIAEKFLGTIAVLFIGVWIARHLGPAQFGKLSFAQSVVAMFSVVALLGLVRILERDLVSKESNRVEIINTALVLILGGATFVYSIILCFLAWRDYEDITNHLIAIVGLSTFFQVNRVYTAYFYSQVKAKRVVIGTVLALLVSNSIKIAFILSQAHLMFFAIAVFLDSAILFPVLLFITRNTEAVIRLHTFSVARAKSLLRDSWPYILSGFLATIYLRIDTVMIKEMMGDYSAGQYAAAARLSEGLYYLPITILASIYPAIVNAKHSSESLYRTRLSNLYSFLFLLGLSISIFVSLFSELIIDTLYGSVYSAAAVVLLIHVWSCVFIFVGTCSGRWLLTENLQVLAAANTFLGASLNIGLNIYLIPRYGIVGAAWATLVSYSFVGYFSFFLWKRTRPNFMLMTRSFMKMPRLSW